jgi:hypothetical protein
VARMSKDQRVERDIEHERLLGELMDMVAGRDDMTEAIFRKARDLKDKHGVPVIHLLLATRVTRSTFYENIRRVYFEEAKAEQEAKIERWKKEAEDLKAKTLKMEAEPSIRADKLAEYNRSIEAEKAGSDADSLQSKLDELNRQEPT